MNRPVVGPVDRPARTIRALTRPRPALLLALLLALLPAAGAHHGIADEGLYPIAGHARVHLDADAEAGLPEILAALEAGAFQPLTDRQTRLGYTRARAWFAVAPPDALANLARVHLLVPSPLLDEVRLVHLRGDDVLSDVTTGITDALDERPVPGRGYALPVHGFDVREDRLLLAVRTRGNLSVSAALATPAGLEAWTRSQRDRSTLFYGAMGALLLLNLMLFVRTGVRALLYLCLFAGATLGHHALLHDTIALALPDLALPGAHRLYLLFVLLSGIGAILFTRHALVLPRATPRLDRAILGLGTLAASIAVLMPLLEVTTAYRLAAGMAMAANPVLIAAAVLRWRQGDRTARTIVVAWSLLLAGITLMALYRAGLVPFEFVTEDNTYLLSAVCALLLSFAVIQRLLLLEDEDRQVERRASDGVRDAAAEGDRMIAELDQNVRQRNRELRAANERLQAIRDETELHAQTLNALFTSSVSIHRAADTDALIDQSLQQLATLFPNHAFGLVVHGDRPGDVRHRAFVRHDDADEQLVIEHAEALARGDHQQLRSLMERNARTPDGVIFQFVDLGGAEDESAPGGRRSTRGTLVIRGPGLPQRSLEVLSVFCTQIATAIENRRLSAELEQLANTDPLTGLGNRKVFDTALARSRAHASSRPRIHFAVMVADLNGLKQVNDGYGHEAGDEMIRHVAEVLVACVRREDTVTRTGGDEFIIVCPSARPQTGEELAGRIESLLARSPLEFRIAGRTEHFDVSVSIGTASSHEVPPEEVVATADARMYDAKERYYAQLGLGSDGRPADGRPGRA
jgi:diguanylate cyclase (GGDEF)-like protein